jgi:hypothetical protein
LVFFWVFFGCVFGCFLCVFCVFFFHSRRVCQSDLPCLCYSNIHSQSFPLPYQAPCSGPSPGCPEPSSDAAKPFQARGVVWARGLSTATGASLK